MLQRACGAVAIILLLLVSPVQASNILATKHNLSSSALLYASDNTVYSLSEDQVCKFCHTPHNANPAIPLWSHQLSKADYTMYSSKSLNTTPPENHVPTGSSKLCLSCHDGTVAVGAVNGQIYPLEGTAGDGTLFTGATNLGTDLSDDHPISIRMIGPGLAKLSPQSPVKLENGYVECGSCHDPHGTEYDKFLVMTVEQGTLCVECHYFARWEGSAHQSADRIWKGKTVAAWGCLGCHTVHGATEQLLLDDGDPEESKLEEVCFRCHDDLRAEFDKKSTHPVGEYAGVHYPTEHAPLDIHVACVDCHNPHELSRTDDPITGLNAALVGVKVPALEPTGYATAPWQPPSYGEIREAQAEYEVCLKCHGSQAGMEFSNPQQKDIDVYFNPNNQASHGCIARNKVNNPYVRAGLHESLRQAWDDRTPINCTDCHGNDADTPRGPHGSEVGWLLRQSKYYTLNSQGERCYYICFDCHDPAVYGYRANNASRSAFRDHNKAEHFESPDIHYAPWAPEIPCLVCHGDFTTNKIGIYAPGGLHGANSGTPGRPAGRENSGYHFLNGYGIYIPAKDHEKLQQAGETITCGGFVDADGYGCARHTQSGRQNYTRGG